MHVTYTPTYPQEVPLLELKPIKGVDEAQCATLKEKLDEEVSTPSGFVSLNTLAGSCKFGGGDDPYLSTDCEGRLSLIPLCYFF